MRKNFEKESFRKDEGSKKDFQERKWEKDVKAKMDKQKPSDKKV